MTKGQQAILNVENRIQNTSAFNIGGVILLDDVDIYKAKLSIYQVIQKNAGMRLRIGQNSKFYIFEGNSNIETYDFSTLSQTQVEQQINEWINQPFNLFDSDLYLINCVKLNSGYMLFLKMHHTIGDGISIIRICKQIERYLYNRKPRTEIDDRIIDVLTKPEEDFTLQRQFFEQIPLEADWLINSRNDNFSSNHKIFELSKNHKLYEVAEKYNVSLITIIYSLIYIYISKIKSTDGVAIGRTLVNRNRDELSMIGMFVNVLPFYMNFSRPQKFSEIVQEIHLQISNFQQYAKYPYSTMLDDIGAQKELFDIEVTHNPRTLTPKFLHGEVVEYFPNSCDANLRIHIIERDALKIKIDYKTSLYEEQDIELFFQRLMCILDQVTENLEISQISILSEVDKSLIGNTTTHISDDIIEIFERQVVKTPLNTAVIFCDEKLTYRQLKLKSDQIFYKLQSKNVNENDIVGVMIDRCAELPAILLGILKSGATFLTVDKDDPRKDKMLSICAIVITKDWLTDLSIYHSDNNYKVGKYAYFMYTSGSTGEPKAVRIKRSSLIVRLSWMQRQFNISGNVLQKTPITFDVSVWELLLPILYGNTVCLMKSGEERNPESIAESIMQNNISTLHFVPSMLNAFLDYEKESFENVLNVFASGEKLHSNSKFKTIFPNAQLHNLYGPTECTIDVTYHTVNFNETDIPIGLPVDNTKIYIVNKNLEVMPIGVVGEILVTGDLVSDGYHEINSTNFIKFNDEYAYKTGDFGKIGDLGEIYYLGRIDNQIKLNGKRIDLSEIEANISSKALEVAVIVKNNILIAYYTAQSDINIDLSKDLPQYMIPTFIIRLEKMPITKNGKLDRKALLDIPITTSILNEPTTQKEAELHSIICELMQIDVGLNDNLLNFGLDSITIIKILSKLKNSNLTLGDFYKTPTIRELANLSTSSVGIEYLKNENSENLVLFFPHAGGDPYSFQKISNLIVSSDVAAINMAYFNETDNFESYICNSVANYKQICLVGHCVGGIIAIKTAENMKNATNLIISGALPTNATKSIWDFTPNFILRLFLNTINSQKSIYTNAILNQYRTDARRYFKYINSSQQISIPCSLIFGSNDLLTFFYNKKYKKWCKFLKSDLKVYEFKDAKHDLIVTHQQQYADVINNIHL